MYTKEAKEFGFASSIGPTINKVRDHMEDAPESLQILEWGFYGDLIRSNSKQTGRLEILIITAGSMRKVRKFMETLIKDLDISYYGIISVLITTPDFSTLVGSIRRSVIEGYMPVWRKDSWKPFGYMSHKELQNGETIKRKRLIG